MKKLKVIHIYSGRNHLTRLHYDFIKLLDEYGYCKLYTFGKRDRGINVIPFDIQQRVSDLISEYEPDIFLTNMKEETIDNLPIGYENIRSIPRIHIEVDWWNHYRSLDWYKKNADLMILKGYWKNMPTPIKTTVSPWSIDENRFFPDPKIVRHSNIGFVGSTGHKASYSVRELAIDTLGNICTDNGKNFKSYETIIKSYLGILSGNGFWTGTARTFETAASGTALLSNKIIGMDKYDLKYYEFKDDCSDIIDVANTLLKESGKRDETVTHNLKSILKNHTHSIRLAELADIFRNFISGGDYEGKYYE